MVRRKCRWWSARNRWKKRLWSCCQCQRRREREHPQWWRAPSWPKQRNDGFSNQSWNLDSQLPERRPPKNKGWWTKRDGSISHPQSLHLGDQVLPKGRWSPMRKWKKVQRSMQNKVLPKRSVSSAGFLNLYRQAVALQRLPQACHWP